MRIQTRWRMRKDYIVLIVGKSGSGKSSICNYLSHKFGLKELKSYTTRPKRNNMDFSHEFITNEEFDKLTDICAYTEFDSNRYCATSAQVDESDLYVIDPDGVKFFLSEYKGKKVPMVVYINCEEYALLCHMIKRGDSSEDMMRRLDHDRVAFSGFADEYATKVYNNNSGDDISVIQNIGQDIYNTFFKE